MCRCKDLLRKWLCLEDSGSSQWSGSTPRQKIGKRRCTHHCIPHPPRQERVAPLPATEQRGSSPPVQCGATRHKPVRRHGQAGGTLPSHLVITCTCINSSATADIPTHCHRNTGCCTHAAHGSFARVPPRCKTPHVITCHPMIETLRHAAVAASAAMGVARATLGSWERRYDLNRPTSQ